MNMKQVQDQTGKLISVPSAPLRIVSLVPSITELLADLGLHQEVVGITKFCVHPEEWFRTKTRIGGTKTISIEKVNALQPDLIFANKEENVKEQVEALAQQWNVYTSDISTIDDAYQMITDVGVLTGTSAAAHEMIQTIQEGCNGLSFQKNLTVLYLIWQDPYMSTGGDTFISSMLSAAGFSNVLHAKSRYPEVTVEEIQALQPDVIFLSSEPYPFKQKHVETLQKIAGKSQILLVDGEIFSWYGSKMLKAPAYFRYLRQQLRL